LEIVDGLNKQVEMISNQLVDIKSDFSQKTMRRLDSLSEKMMELSDTVEKLSQSVKNGRNFRVFLLVLNILGLGILAFILLCVLGVIPS